jgi:glycosyltransferase involved in cell wall biosynthesis
MEQSALNNSQGKPLVSIVVPVYNVEKYLSKCLTSLINQTYTNIEIIIVNDGSTDNGPQIIRDFEEKDARIKVIHKPNEGLASARNTGVALATGEYIWHVDSDDYTNTDSLEKMVEVAVRDQCDIVVTGYKIIPDIQNPENFIIAKPKFDKIITGHEALLKMLSVKIGADPWAKLYKRILYTENTIFIEKPYLRAAPEDILLNYQMFKYANNVSPLNEVTINHIYREGSIYSKSIMKNIKNRALEHLAYVYMGTYGFPNKDIEYAWRSYVGRDFIGCFRIGSKSLLKEIDAVSIGKIYEKLSYLSDYKLVSDGVYFSSKTKRMAFSTLRFKSIRVFVALFMKIMTLGFKK